MLHPTAPRTAKPRHLAGRSRLPVAGLALVVAVAACGLWWMSTHRSVTLLVDGRLSHHETHAATVADFLGRSGVEVRPEDEVVPALDTPLRHGMRVEVVHAREVTLLIGDSTQHVVASALTVDDLLGELGHSETIGDAGARRLLRPSRLTRLREGMVVELSDPVALTLVHDGQQREVVATDRTIGDLLDRLEIELGPADRVTPPPEEPVAHGLVVTVERVDVAFEARQEQIPFNVEERATSGLLRGQRRVARAGVEGRLEVLERIVVVDGVEEVRRPLTEQLVAGPVSEIVEVGIAIPAEPVPQPEPEPPAPQPPPAGAPSADSAPQQGETPGAVEDSSPAHVQHGRASWYDNPHGGYTAAHRTLPRGTRVRVTNVANGRSVEVRINDRGPYVTGRVIDLNREAFAALAPTSRGVIQVRIEW